MTMKNFLTIAVSLVLAFSSLSVAKPAKATKSAKPAKAKSAEYKDARDKQKYRLVKIADREWFADNLNYKMDGSYCLNDDENNCMAYGRLYTWDAAQKACPAGFRLPAQADFESLWTAAGADFNAGYLIKTDYGWKGETNGKGRYTRSCKGYTFGTSECDKCCIDTAYNRVSGCKYQRGYSGYAGRQSFR